MTNVIVNIESKPLFTEDWHEGYVEDEEGNKYQFWLINPRQTDPNGQDFECEVRWFFKNVPREVRSMQNSIIELFKLKKEL